MRFLSVAERELRAGARQKRTHRLRWVTALAFFALLVWLIWVFDGFRGGRRAPDIFEAFSVVIFIYCLLIGAARTADCISAERREGTLGLLYLTNLNSAEIVAGKLCSNALAAVYGLFAIFPMLGLVMLMGGITFGHFWRTVLALANAIFFSVAAGFLASAFCVRQFTAIAAASGLALLFGAGLLAVATTINALGGSKSLAEIVALFCPLYALIQAPGRRVLIGSHYWLSLTAVASLSWAWLGLATWRLAWSWRDKPQKIKQTSRIRFVQRWRQMGSAGRAALRRRLLDVNPFFWLDGRRRITAPVFMVLTIAVVAVTSTVAAPYFGRVMGAGVVSPLAGHLFAWLWAGLAIHALVLYYAAMVASRRLAEDMQSGALELVLSTPTTLRSISRGLWLAYARRMLFPGIVAILVHLFFIWQGAATLLMVVDAIPRGTTPGQLIWRALLKLPVTGRADDWSFPFALRLLLLILALFIIIWITLGWLGRWLGLRMKHPGFAPLTSLALVFIPPVILFTFFCYLTARWHWDQMGERQFIPLMVWVGFGMGAVHCLLLSVWSAMLLRREFRTVVTSRFQPVSLRPWWLPRWRTLARLAIGGAGLATAVVLIVIAYYGYQNWHSRRTWALFQTRLKQRGESLEIATLLPGSVPEDQNFVRSPAFRRLLTRNNAGAAMLNRFRQYISSTPSGSSGVGLEWVHQKYLPLGAGLNWVVPGARLAPTNRVDAAPALLRALQAQNESLRELAAAARLPRFQVSTNRDAVAVLRSVDREATMLEELHFLYQLRASALLTEGRGAEAGDDILTSLELARLARQLPDTGSTARMQSMLARSLQPLWEGLAEHQWKEEQLAAFQSALAGFNLLTDYTNAVRRVALAYIDIWRAIPDSGMRPTSVPVGGGVYQYQPGWQTMPRAWWFERCVQLYEAGQHSIDRVDVTRARVQLDMDWSDLSGLMLDGATSDLIEQYNYKGADPELVGFTQTAVNQAIMACALERFRLANGRYPETLTPLVTRYLDRLRNDLMSGKPMIYQYLDPDHFILRGVGPNGVDDRKSPASDDWLWTYPTNTPAADK